MNTTFDRQAGKEEWLTPKHILDAVGPFDLDPCAPVAARRPWPMARVHYTIEDNGLLRPWHGFVWCNPPYGNQTRLWLQRMTEHNNGIALTFARTETKMFFNQVWRAAAAVFFIRGRLSFCDTAGRPGGPAGAPSVLIAYGQHAKNRLFGLGLPGHYLDLDKGSAAEPLRRGQTKDALASPSRPCRFTQKNLEVLA